MSKKHNHKKHSDAKAFLDQTAKGGQESGDVSESQGAEASADSQADETQPEAAKADAEVVKPAKAEAKASESPADKYAGIPRKLHKFI